MSNFTAAKYFINSYLFRINGVDITLEGCKFAFDKLVKNLIKLADIESLVRIAVLVHKSVLSFMEQTANKVVT